MTEEVKTCDCKEKCIARFSKFVFITAAVFLGVLLAILLSAHILRPKCPPAPYGMVAPYPGMERQLPPPPMARGERGFQPAGNFRAPQQKGEFGRNFKHQSADKNVPENVKFRPDKSAE